MHNHYDRDYFINVIWENVEPEGRIAFRKVNPLTSSNFGTSYDYESIMHYEYDGFSQNGQPTIVTRDPKYRKLIGKFEVMSKGDIKRINNMYQCYE
jgi:hypothetical protein